MSQTKYRYEVIDDVTGWEVGQVLELGQPIDRGMRTRVRVLAEQPLETAKNDKPKSKAVPKKSKDKSAK